MAAGPEPVTFEVLVEVSLRPGIADPQGATVERALPVLGYDTITDVRVGKAIRFTVEAADEATACAEAEELSRRLLSNPVIEQCRVCIEATGGAPTGASTR